MTTIDTRSIRLILIDDHAMFRDGLACLLERESGMVVAGCFGSTGDALDALPGLDANMILLDYNLGAERTLDFVAAAKTCGFTGAILMVTAGLTNPEAVQLIGAGVRGIVHKHNSPETLSMMLGWARDLKSLITSTGIDPKYNIWVELLLEERQLLFMFFTIAARILLAIIAAPFTSR